MTLFYFIAELTAEVKLPPFFLFLEQSKMSYGSQLEALGNRARAAIGVMTMRTK